MRLSLISLLAYAYLVSFTIISHFFPIPEAYKSLIAQLGLLIVPYLVGKPILFLIKKFLSVEKEIDFIIHSVITWSLGIIFMIVLEAFLYVSFLFFIDSYVVILLFIGLFSLFIKEKTNFKSIKCRELWIAALYGFLFSLFITSFWGYPYAGDNDYIRHMYYSVKIVRDNRPLIFYAPYLPTMHTLYGVLIQIFNVGYDHALFLLWSSRFLFYPIYSVGLFLFIFQISKNKLQSLALSFIGSSLVYSVEASLFPWHTAPKNVISILFIYLLYISLRRYDTNRMKGFNLDIIKLSIPLFLSFALLYFLSPDGFIGYEIGYLLVLLFTVVVLLPKTTNCELRWFFLSFVALSQTLIFFGKTQGFLGGVIVLLFLFLLFTLEHFSTKTCKLLTSVAMLVPVAIFALINFNLVSYPQEPIIPSVFLFLFGWNNLMMFMNSVYPPTLLFFLVLGCIFVIVTNEDKKILGVSVILSLVVFAFFLPIALSYRFLVYAHPFIIALSGYGVFKLVGIIRLHHKRVLAYLLLIGFLVPIGTNIYLHNIQEFERSVVIRNQDRYQIFQMGEFIKNGIDKDVVAVGYMFHQRLYAYYGQIDFINLWKGGDRRDYIIEEIYSVETSQKAYDKLKNLLNDREYFIMSIDKEGREIDRFCGERTVSDLILLYDEVMAKWYFSRNSVAKFFDGRFFELLFITENSDGEKFYVFKANEEPINITCANLLRNPSFEEGWNSSSHSPIAWDARYSKVEILGTSLDENEKSSGSYSYRVETPVGHEEFGPIGQSIEVEEGETYLVRASIKTYNAKNSSINIFYYDSEESRWRVLGLLEVPEVTSHWREYYQLLDIPENVTEIIIVPLAGCAQDGSKGEAITWFDDIALIGPNKASANGS